MNPNPSKITEHIQAVRISEIVSVEYFADSEDKAELHIDTKHRAGSRLIVYSGSVDQVRRRFDYLVNKQPDDTKEFLILSYPVGSKN